MCRKQFCDCFGFALLRFVIGEKILRRFINQSKVTPKLIGTYSHAFPRDWRQRRVFTLTAYWFTRLSAYVVISQSNSFTFGFTTLENRSYQHKVNKCHLKVELPRTVISSWQLPVMADNCLLWLATGCYGQQLAVMADSWLLWSATVCYGRQLDVLAGSYLLWSATGCYGGQQLSVMADNWMFWPATTCYGRQLAVMAAGNWLLWPTTGCYAGRQLAVMAAGNWPLL